jgi:hypothetical protein
MFFENEIQTNIMILLIIIFSKLWEIFNQKLAIGFSKKMICDWEDF